MEITLDPISFRNDWESPKIAKLKSQLKNGRKEAIEGFWKEVQEKGTPLIEPIEGEKESWATFIWRAVKPHKNVVVAEYGLASFDPHKNMMVPIEGTDIWYKTYRFPNNLKLVYTLSPDDPLISIADYKLEDEVFTHFTQNWTNDPLNPKKYLMPANLCLGNRDHEMSLLEMPGAQVSPWSKESNLQGKIFEEHVPSRYLEKGRDVYVYLPPGHDPHHKVQYPLLVAFDGFAFKEHYHAPAMLDYLISQKKIEPLVCVMIQNPDPNPVTRARDLACHEPFFRFLAMELVPWASNRFNATREPDRTIVTGASMGGLAAAYAALSYPNIFGNVLAQSGVYWWPIQGNADWLIHRYIESPKLDLRFFLDVGIMETVPTFGNGPSILNSSKTLRDVLRTKGYSVSYVEYAGGHDYISWQETLAVGLQELISP